MLIMGEERTTTNLFFCSPFVPLCCGSRFGRILCALVVVAVFVVRGDGPLAFGDGCGLAILVGAAAVLSALPLAIVRSARASASLAITVVTVFTVTASIALLPRISMRPMRQPFAASLPATLPLGRDGKGAVPTALLGRCLRGSRPGAGARARTRPGRSVR